MKTTPSDDPEFVRVRRPHWQRKAFWKTFGMVFVIYIVLRVSITAAIDWSKGPADQPDQNSNEPAPDSK